MGVVLHLFFRVSCLSMLGRNRRLFGSACSDVSYVVMVLTMTKSCAALSLATAPAIALTVVCVMCAVDVLRNLDLSATG